MNFDITSKYYILNSFKIYKNLLGPTPLYQEGLGVCFVLKTQDLICEPLDRGDNKK